jgi:hypothetical protein
MTTPPPANPWEFQIVPYGWLTALDGSTGPNIAVADVDASFGDIFDKIDMAAALQAEAKYGRWGVFADAFYAKLSDGATLRGPLQTNLNLGVKQFLGELDVFYRIHESDRGFYDIYGGVRYNSQSLDLRVSASSPNRAFFTELSTDEDWADPIIGLRGQWNFNEHWHLAGKGDIGGFGASSDFTWNLQATAGYRINESVALELGYRYFDTDYSSSSFTYDLAQFGAIIALNVTF